MTVTVDGCKTKQHLLYIRVRNHGYNFLVDTGAEISILLQNSIEKLVLGLYKLQVDNGTKIKIIGEKSLTTSLVI